MFIQFAEENLLLWYDIEKWKVNFIINSVEGERFRVYFANSFSERVTEASRIVSTYFHEKSPFEVNLDYKVKNHIEDRIENDMIDITLFDQAHRSVYVRIPVNCCTYWSQNLMEISLFPGFLSSQIFSSLNNPVRRSSFYRTSPISNARPLSTLIHSLGVYLLCTRFCLRFYPTGGSSYLGLLSQFTIHSSNLK